ncbi:MAG: hypothetical protein Q8Q62_12485, partial [Mesorhizobium sp.]|nr:hypothetical protein [Mesorhizobium sp.]
MSTSRRQGRACEKPPRIGRFGSRFETPQEPFRMNSTFARLPLARIGLMLALGGGPAVPAV